jgi:cell division protein FtsB
LLPRDAASSQAPEVILEPEIPDRTAKYTRRIADLEGRVKMLKQQVITAMDQAEKSSTISKNMSLLEDQVSALKLKITQLEDGSLYMTEILEAAREQLNCQSLGAPEYFLPIYVLLLNHILL